MHTLRERVRTIVFESETPAGRAFDAILIACTLASGGPVFLGRESRLRECVVRVFLFTVLSLVAMCGFVMPGAALARSLRAR
jgi:hypothetical protein